MAVSKIVENKQDFETQFITRYLFTQPGLLRAIPAKAASLKAIDTSFRDVHRGLLENCESALRPVSRTIKIEELPAKSGL